MPKIGSGTFTDPYRPAYIPRVVASIMDYGREPWMLVFADVTPAQHTEIMTNADATAIPANLDSTVGSALATVQAKLEAANIPSQWVTSGMTWRVVVKWTIRILQIMNRFYGLNGVAERLFSLVTMDDPVSSIPQTTRQRLISAAQTLGLDTSDITLAMTVRAALIQLGQQWTVPITVRGEQF